MLLRLIKTGTIIALALPAFCAVDCNAADQRRVKYDTVACMDYGHLTQNFQGSMPKGSRPVSDCIPLREGDNVVVEREQGGYALVRPGAKVDHYWMPLDPVRWKKP